MINNVLTNIIKSCISIHQRLSRIFFLKGVTLYTNETNKKCIQRFINGVHCNDS